MSRFVFPIFLLLATLAAWPVAAQDAGPAGGALTVAFGAESTTMNPVKFAGGVDHYFLSQMFETLIRPDPSLKTVNWIAESWSIEHEGGKAIIDVRLRRGVTFHNGDPLTSQDFEFSLERMRDPKANLNAHEVASVESFETIDDHHFRLHFKEPDGNFVANNLQLWALPKDYYSRVGEQEFGRAPVGTGPWRFVSRTVKEELRLEAYDGYWNKQHRPTVKTLIIKIIPEDLTRVAAFKTGAVDWMDAVPLSMVEEFRRMPGVRTASLITGNNLFLNFGSHLAGSPFRDVRVRQAAAYAIDVDMVIRTVLFGQGERYVEVGKGTLGYDPDLKPYPYDPKRARELLRQAGYPNGFDIPCYSLTTPREPNMKEMSEAMFAYLSQVGIRCKVRGLEYNAWLTLARRRPTPPDMDGVISFMSSHGLPGDVGRPWSTHMHSLVAGTGWGNSSYSEDEAADRMLEQLKTVMDLTERAAVVRKLARYKHDNVLGGLTTYRPIATYAWRDNLKFVPWPWPGYWHGFQEIGRAN